MDIREFAKPEVAGTVNTAVETPKAVPITTTTELIGPVDETLEYLKEEGITEEAIFSILDTMLTTGTVVWDFKVFEKIPARFQMRPAWINEILIKALEDEAPKTVARFSDIVAKYNMAGSLVAYNNEEFKVTNKDEYYINMERTHNLNYAVYSVLVKQLALFDKVISVATSTWAIENFTKPPLEEPAPK